MKPKHLFTSMLAVTALFVASCSTSKLAQNSAVQDDVYNTTAQAKEYREVVPQEVIAQNTEDSTQRVDDYYGSSDPYYDMDYSTRINRFYYANPWRTYYDGYYGYNSYLFNPYFDPYSFSFGYGGINNWFSPFSYWGYYGSPYYNNFWGPYSYNNPYYGGGFYGGGFYGGGGYYGSVGRGTRNPNYGPRPTRGSENGINRANGGYNGNPGGIAGRTSSGSRAERYNPTNGTTSGTRANGNATSTARPTRSNDGRPTRSNDSPPARTYSPPQQSSPPPSSSGSSSRGGSSSSSGSSSSGGRPTRGGGR